MNHSVEEIAQIIGADSLGYLSLEHVVKLAQPDKGYCLGCFSGHYPTEVPTEIRKSRFEQKISESEGKK